LTVAENEKRWKELHDNPRQQNGLRPEIRDSWDRCRQNGIVPGLVKLPAACRSGNLHIQHPGNLIQAFRNVSDLVTRFLVPDNAAVLFDKNG
jgi:transcriptional regulator of acetoin/glycerol metabolism